MIIKVSTKKPGTVSSFAKLAEYINGAPKENERVLSSWVENLYGEDFTDQIREVEATQDLNQLTQSDKTYHLIVAFPPGERPSDEALKDIDNQIAAELGLSENQRMVAVHDDTDHLHMHIAINKVHPETHKLITPFRDFKTLLSVARDLEHKHGLQPLAEEKTKDGEKLPISSRANDFEQHSKTVSFSAWAIGELQEPLKHVLSDPKADWHQLHAVLADKGLEIKPRGRGLIITTANGRLFVKPSDIDRNLSRGKLEAQFGAFKPSMLVPKKCPYAPAPKNNNAATKQLFAEYQKTKNKSMALRKARFKEYSVMKADKLSEIRSEFQARRVELRKDKTIPKYRKGVVSRKITAARLAAHGVANQHFKAERERIIAETASQTWVEYLVEKASLGDENARKALKTHEAKQKNTTDHITAVGIPKNTALFVDDSLKAKPIVNKNGSLTYKLNKNNKLVMKTNAIDVYGADDETLKTALLIARKKYGPNLRFKGSPAFIARCNETINKHKLRISVQEMSR